MQLVRNANGAGALVLVLVLALGGCGDGSEGEREVDGGPALAAPINLADCTDWNDASVEERFGTIAQIRNFTGGQVAGQGGVEGTTLDDEKAYDLFEAYCENEFARGFRLYKLYGRAAAFSGAAEAAEQAGADQPPITTSKAAPTKPEKAPVPAP